MKRTAFLFLACATCFLALAFVTKPTFEAQTNVVDVLKQFGEPMPDHYLSYDTVLVRKGRDLVFTGRTTNQSGKPSKYISKYFVCTNCHNTVQEDPVIYDLNPEKRLDYCIEKGIPFLQGSTFWGIANRESWYNDDYVKKYGELVYVANNSLREATQLCAIECSQGRPLEKWEEDAILAYYWSLQLKMEDLNLSDKDLEIVRNGLSKEGDEAEFYVDLLKSKYATRSPATFMDPLDDKKKGYPHKGDPKKGREIFEISCRHCHQEGGVSDFLLDYSKYTMKYLKKNLYKKNRFSLYEIIRKGTYSMPGAVPYMPHYPKEKMSDQQIEDLVAFVLLNS